MKIKSTVRAHQDESNFEKEVIQYEVYRERFKGRFKKYMSSPCLLFKPVFAWPQHHGNAITWFISIKFHLMAMLACHFDSVVIFNLFSPWNTETSHTISA